MKEICHLLARVFFDCLRGWQICQISPKFRGKNLLKQSKVEKYLLTKDLLFLNKCLLKKHIEYDLTLCKWIIKIIQEMFSSICFYSILPEAGLAQTLACSWLWGPDAEAAAELAEQKSQKTELAERGSEQILEATLEELLQHWGLWSDTDTQGQSYLLQQHSPGSATWDPLHRMWARDSHCHSPKDQTASVGCVPL